MQRIDQLLVLHLQPSPKQHHVPVERFVDTFLQLLEQLPDPQQVVALYPAILPRDPREGQLPSPHYELL